MSKAPRPKRSEPTRSTPSTARRVAWFVAGFVTSGLLVLTTQMSHPHSVVHGWFVLACALAGGAAAAAWGRTALRALGQAWESLP